MAIIQDSGKFSTSDAQFIIVSGNTVLFRAVDEQHGFKLMTATAKEDGRDLKPYADQESLIRESRAFFLTTDRPHSDKRDFKGRPYVEAYSFRTAESLAAAANEIGYRLGIVDIQVLALEDAKRIFEEFVADDGDEEAYLSDGYYVRADGSSRDEKG